MAKEKIENTSAEVEETVETTEMTNAAETAEAETVADESSAEETSKAETKSSAPAANISDKSISEAITQGRKRKSKMITISGGAPMAETIGDINKANTLDIIESYKSQRILTDALEAVEILKDSGIVVGLLHHGLWKILIPVDEAIAVDYSKKKDGYTDSQWASYLYAMRNGSVFNYIVHGYNKETLTAYASRIDAMAKLKNRYYFATNHNKENRVQTDCDVEVKVVAVRRAGIIVDAFGVEVNIPLSELSWSHLQDATAAFQVGQYLMCKVVELNKDISTRKVNLVLSHKVLLPDPYIPALRDYKEGMSLPCRVEYIDAKTANIYCSLPVGADVLCKNVNFGKAPVRGSTANVKITKIDAEKRRIFGIILRVGGVMR